MAEGQTIDPFFQRFGWGKTPSQAHLDELRTSTCRIRISDRIEDGRILYQSVEPRTIGSLFSVLRIREQEEYGRHLSIGDVAVDCFGADGKEIAGLQLLAGTAVRWQARWEAEDAPLAKPEALAAWLAQRGFPRYQDELDAAERSGAREEALRAAWRAAMPSVLHPVWDENSKDPIDDVASYRQVLYRALPTNRKRARALLAWLGSGTLRYSGFPPYEDTPRQLLNSLDLADITAVLAEDSSESVWRGAVRFFLSIDFCLKRRKDLIHMDLELRARLHEAARQMPDPDWADRARRFLAL